MDGQGSGIDQSRVLHRHLRLPAISLAHLEIMVLAQVVIAVLSYDAWWHKPMSVESPVLVSALRLSDVQPPLSVSFSARHGGCVPGHSYTDILYAYIFDGQVSLYVLSQECK